MQSIEATRDFTSIGQLAAHIQRPVRAIETAAIDLGIVPAIRLNHVPYFDGRQVERLTESLREDQR
jgi:hypothetical protein